MTIQSHKLVAVAGISLLSITSSVFAGNHHVARKPRVQYETFEQHTQFKEGVLHEKSPAPNTLDEIAVKDNFARSFAIPDTPMRIRFFGYVSGTFLYDFSDQGPSDTISPESIGTLSPSVKNGNVRFNASRTNFGIEVRTPVPGLNKPLKMVLISGYSPLANSSVLGAQIEHVKQLIANDESNIIAAAYVEFDDFMFGQYATNFMDINGLPELLNFGGNAGAYGIAAPQAKYTYRFGCRKNNQFAIAVENPQSEYTLKNVKVTSVGADAPFNGFPAINYYSSGIPSAFLTDPAVHDQLPDVTLSFNTDQDWGHFFASVVLRELNVSGRPVSPMLNPAVAPGVPVNGQGLLPTIQDEVDAHAFAYGINVSGLYKVGCQDNLTGHVTYGYGLGRYALGTVTQSAYIDLDKDPNHFERLHSWVGSLAYQHYWADHWRSTFLYGFVNNDTDAQTPKVINKWIQSYVVNLMYVPSPIVRVGVEYIYMKRAFVGEPKELFLQRTGDLSRIEAQARLYF